MAQAQKEAQQALDDAWAEWDDGEHPGRRATHRDDGLHADAVRPGLRCCSSAPGSSGSWSSPPGPLIYTGYLSLTDYDVINDPTFVGLDNYQAAARGPEVAPRAEEHVHLRGDVGARPARASPCLALLLNRAGRASGFFRTAFFLPKMTPPVAIGVLLLLLFNGQSGLINQCSGSFGIDGPAWTTDPALGQAGPGDR